MQSPCTHTGSVIVDSACTQVSPRNNGSSCVGRRCKPEEDACAPCRLSSSVRSKEVVDLEALQVPRSNCSQHDYRPALCHDWRKFGLDAALPVLSNWSGSSHWTHRCSQFAPLRVSALWCRYLLDGERKTVSMSRDYREPRGMTLFLLNRATLSWGSVSPFYRRSMYRNSMQDPVGYFAAEN